MHNEIKMQMDIFFCKDILDSLEIQKFPFYKYKYLTMAKNHVQNMGKNCAQICSKHDQKTIFKPCSITIWCCVNLLFKKPKALFGGIISFQDLPFLHKILKMSIYSSISTCDG